MRFFIHHADSGFPHEPWPGERRLGGFDTVEEATAQAVSDAAAGHGLALGVWDSLSDGYVEGEEVYANGWAQGATRVSTKPAPVVTPDEIARGAEVLLEAQARERDAARREQAESLKAHLERNKITGPVAEEILSLAGLVSKAGR